MLKLACAVVSMDGFGDTDFVKTFELAPQVGFEYIEFNCWYPRTLTPSKMRDLRRRCADAGLKPAALHIGSLGGASHDELTKDVCHKLRAAECALELGCRMVTMSGYKRGTAGGLGAVIATLQVVAPEYEALGVQLGLENHCDNNLETIADYQAILAAVPGSSVGICIDTGHFDAAGVDILELINLLGARVNHVHLKENAGKGKKVFTRFGEGTTDNHAVLRALIQRGYSGFMTVELSPEIWKHDDRPFSLDDLRRPYEMFSPYVTS